MGKADRVADGSGFPEGGSVGNGSREVPHPLAHSMVRTWMAFT